MKIRFALPLVALFLFSNAEAGFLIEPFAGYGSASNEIVIASAALAAMNGTTKSSGSGYHYGGRLGYGFGRIAFGGEYLGASYKISGTNSAASAISAFAEFRVPGGLSLLGGYAFSASGDGLEDGSGFKAGLGYKVADHFKVMAEYVALSYKDISARPAAGGASATYKTDLKIYQLTFSFPIELGGK